MNIQQRTVVLGAAAVASGVAAVLMFVTAAAERRRRRALIARGQRLLLRGQQETLTYAVGGDAFVDILASGVGELPQWNSDCLAGAPIQLSSGGSAMNTAIHLKELGARVELHTAVGDDDFGRFLTQSAQQRGLTMVNHEMAQ